MEKINFCSAMQPKSLKEFPEERCEFCADYYRAADVDALFVDVRRLVDEAKLLIESAEDSHSYCDCYEVATLLKCSRDTEKAIAAVEAIISPPRSSPPPADTGKA